MTRSNGLSIRLNLWRMLYRVDMSVRNFVSEGVSKVVNDRVVVCFDFAKVGANT